MNSAPRPLDRFALLTMVLLCASWGLNQVAAKLAFVDVAPITQSALRSGLGSIVLLIYAWREKPQIFRADGTLGSGLAVGLLFAAEFIALFLSLRLTTASSAVVFLFTAPFFVGAGAFLLPASERLRPLQWLGMGLAFVGVVVGLYRSSPGATLQGDLLALLAGAFWGATTVVLKATKLSRSDPVKTLLYQTLTATLASAIFAFLIGEPFPVHLSMISALSLGYQSLYVVGFTYLVWFWLLKTYRAAELSAFTFISPIVGVFAGWLVFGDRLTPTFLLAVAMVAAGVLTINWPAKK